MPVALKKILAVFIVLASLPLVYVVYELSSLNKNEEAITEIYADQLDAILFSINQYSVDLITNWSSEISTIHNHSHLSRFQKIQDAEQVITKFPSLETAYFPVANANGWIYGIKQDSIKQKIDSLLEKKQRKVEKLIRYKKAGYFRMELLDSTAFSPKLPVLFAHDTLDGVSSVGVILVDIDGFVKQDLGPKIQGIAAEQFLITVRHKDSLVHSSDLDYSLLQLPTQTPGKIYQHDFWLLPEYFLQISAKGRTIEQVVQRRRVNTLIVLGLLLFTSALSMAVLFGSIRREIYLSQAKSEFVSNVSHELRTPLSLISMFAETLEMDRVKTEDKKKEYYGIIKKETHRLAKIVNGILSFSQIDAKKRDYQFEVFDVNEVIKDVWQNYVHQFEEEGFEHTILLHEERLVISADRKSVKEVIINIIDNAIKYSHDIKKVVLVAGSERRMAYIEIKDSGIGIPKKYQTEVFDQFFRTPNKDVHDTKGSGLGLAIVKRIMNAHDGSVELESISGKGSTFRLEFPLA